jgi:ribosomal protein S6
MKNYEAMFILDTRGKDDAAEDIITRIEAEIKAQGGSLNGKPQKVGRIKFERAPGPIDAGFYVNIRFSAPTPALAKLRERFTLDTSIFRQTYLVSRAAVAPRKAAKAVAAA